MYGQAIYRPRIEWSSSYFNSISIEPKKYLAIWEFWYFQNETQIYILSMIVVARFSIVYNLSINVFKISKTRRFTGFEALKLSNIRSGQKNALTVADNWLFSESLRERAKKSKTCWSNQFSYFHAAAAAAAAAPPC